MNYILLGLVTVAALLFAILYKDFEKKLKINKILAVSLFLIYLVRLFLKDKIYNVFNVLLYDIETPIDSTLTWLFSPGMTVFIIILRWLTVVSMLWLVIMPFNKTKEFKYLGAVVGSLVGILNFLFFKENLIAFTGIAEIWSFRSIQFMLENSLILFIGLSVLINLISKKEFKLDFKKWYRYLFVIVGSMFSVMPQSILYNLFGNYGESPLDFNMEHIFVIIFPIILMIFVYMIMRRQIQENKDAVIIYMAFAGFIQYFSVQRLGLAALPLHLCNTAVILLLLAVVFRIKRFFYFSYFANVLGAIAAIILPNYTTDFFSIGVMHFGFNHMYAFIIPILAVALHTFERPILSHMYKAIMVFTVYFFTVVFLNAWFNNFTTVDYFFTYSDFLTEMFGARELQYNNVISFNYQDLTFTFYWAFQLIFYFVFIFLMFASWFVYDASYQMADQHHRLKERQKRMRVDKLKLLELLDGRKLSEPMNPGGLDMIKISHFSKRYGQSEKYAVKDFSLEVHGGEIFGFLGHNGAGKSTTIKSIVGIQSITEGEIEVCGYSIKSQPLETKLRIGYVSDNHAVYEKLTGREYINYVADLYRVPNDIRDQRLNDLAKKLSLIDAIDQMIKSYSHGMKQKLVVIASLIHEPPVWILDEPLTGLDPISSFEIKEIMREHAKKGNIVFFSSHVIEVVEKICTKISVINKGELTGIYYINILKYKNLSL
ncbi:MAG: YwaF family protein [Candidatus Izemoplasmatales bacterium]|jgi:ABC-2 type transport system ATP-binding protein|nr:YwaF family protein [Candidatus Izemoplasmatales bacterium]